MCLWWTDEVLLLSPDSTYGVRLWLQGHAKFRSDAWNVAFGKLQMKLL